MDARTRDALLRVTLTMELVRVRERRSAPNPLRELQPARVHAGVLGYLFAYDGGVAYALLRVAGQDECDTQVIEYYAGPDVFEARVYARHGALLRDEHWTGGRRPGPVAALLDALRRGPDMLAA